MSSCLPARESKQHPSKVTQSTHRGVGSVGDTARCMVMGLVKYTRYPEETGRGVKPTQGEAGYPGWFTHRNLVV